MLLPRIELRKTTVRILHLQQISYASLERLPVDTCPPVEVSPGRCAFILQPAYFSHSLYEASHLPYRGSIING